MGRYEMTIKIAQVQRLVEERKYKKAAAVLATLDVRQIRSKADLNTIAEVYVKTEQFGAAKAIYLRLYKKHRTKRILYRLIYLAIRTNELEEAEDFYEEFLGLSHSTRDNLILRYRIDKAKGVPISQLIETLEILKDEEYVEEWAYELAKLYQRAGRNDDCRRECEDIILWFGQGEIVERADMLLDYLDGDPQLFYEDKDFTVGEEEEPNPDDTGSLPDLSPEIMKQEIGKLKQKKKEEKSKKRESSQEKDSDEFVDDYDEKRDFDEGEMLMEPGELAQMAKEGLMKLSGFWKRGEKTDSEKEETKDATAVEQTLVSEKEKQTADTNADLSQSTNPTDAAGQKEVASTVEEIMNSPQDEKQKEKPSQSGMGITQDLAKEISAIFEAERREQLKEKAVAVMNEVPDKMGEVSNVAVSVVDRMAQAMQNKAGKSYIPLDVTETPAKQEQEEGFPQSGEQNQPAETVVQQPGPMVQKPDGMEEITVGETSQKEEEVTMIELDQIMPEPDIPELKQVIPEDSPELGNQPALEEKDLPTTKALHHSFDDMLTLIAGEREPKHFVLMGEGEEKILGITKKIVRVMNRKGFMSTNQIARIHSQQLNDMDLLRVCNQIKGSCLLIDGAAQLLFPTITKIFAVMDAFHGDFVVVLADEGNTLDELFRVAPALARRFEYVIDISQYDEEDYL